MLRKLNTEEIQAVSAGGADGLIEALFVMAGLAVVGAYALGVASVCAYDYFMAEEIEIDKK